jgi:hypothetical protein
LTCWIESPETVVVLVDTELVVVLVDTELVVVVSFEPLAECEEHPEARIAMARSPLDSPPRLDTQPVLQSIRLHLRSRWFAP